MSDKRKQLFKDFSSHIKSLERTRKKTENLFALEKMSKRDIEQVYKGLFLDMISEFESVIEEMFVGLLVKKYKIKSKKFKPKIIFKTNQLARSVIYSNKNYNKDYINWLPYRQTIDLAKIYFASGYPFCTLGFSCKSNYEIENLEMTLNDMSAIRNAIAHKSNHAQNKFSKSISRFSLGPKEKTPAGFLRNNFRMNPNQNRYEYFMSEIISFVNRFVNL